MRRTVGIAVIASLVAASASAQPRDAQRADVLFREGRVAMKSGDLDVACPKLEKSYQFDPAAGTAVNLGDCFEKQGKVASALLAYQAARKLLHAGDLRNVPVEKQIAALERRAPKLTITLAPDAPEGTRVARDGKKVDFADFGRAFAVNPGTIVVVVSAEGHQDEKQVVALREGEAAEIVARVGAPSGPKKSDDGRQPVGARGARDQSAGRNQSPDGSVQRTIGYVVGGAGIVLVIVGGVYWGKAVETESTRCPPGCDAGALVDQENDQRAVAMVTIPVGLGALASGIVLVLLAPDQQSASSLTRSGPNVAGGAYGLKLGGTW